MVEEELLTPREAADEALVMGLRLSEGIDVGALEERFGVDVVDRRSVRELTASGFLAERRRQVGGHAAGAARPRSPAGPAGGVDCARYPRSAFARAALAL